MSPADHSPGPDLRIDPYLGTAVYIVGTRQQRPNLTAAHPRTDCPFCPGGLEAPDPYRTRWFVNRWPALPDDRCEVVLYSPDHDASLASLDVSDARQVVELWAERTVALGARSDVAYVLIFENRGADVGATIAHPHGQIYAYDHVPPRPATMFSREWRPSVSTDRLVVRNDTWTAAVPEAPSFPVALSIAPIDRVGSLPALDDAHRHDLAAILVDVS
ncbi:MAG: galactose-1-phosphate uridylyltransferase, partial [Ilumatobacteraceae bacterium]